MRKELAAIGVELYIPQGPLPILIPHASNFDEYERLRNEGRIAKYHEYLEQQGDRECAVNADWPYHGWIIVDYEEESVINLDYSIGYLASILEKEVSVPYPQGTISHLRVPLKESSDSPAVPPSAQISPKF